MYLNGCMPNPLLTTKSKFLLFQPSVTLFMEESSQMSSRKNCIYRKNTGISPWTQAQGYNGVSYGPSSNVWRDGTALTFSLEAHLQSCWGSCVFSGKGVWCGQAPKVSLTLGLHWNSLSSSILCYYFYPILTIFHCNKDKEPSGYGKRKWINTLAC